jgi:hypothetical protein
MSEENRCHICGGKVKNDVQGCKKCKADPSEKIITDCRAIKYANAFMISAYVNLVLTDRRLIAFEDIKGALLAGTAGGSANHGLVGDLISVGLTVAIEKATERAPASGINGSVKFEAPISSVTSVDTEVKKNVVHTFINSSGNKPLRVVLGTSFDDEITGDMFIATLLETTRPG